MVSDVEVDHVSRIIKVLKKYPYGLWVREIARQSGLHMEQVRRVILKYPELFEEYADFTNYKINLKIIRLKKKINLKNLKKLLTMLEDDNN